MRWLQLRELSSSIANLSPLSERLSVAASECLTHAYNRGSESYTSRQGEPHGQPSLTAKLGAEFLGTFLLVFVGCGSVVVAAEFVNKNDVQQGIGLLGIAI